MRQWIIKQTDNLLLPNLPEYPAFILKLLSLRGIDSEEEISNFLKPDYGNLHDPFLFSDMQTAVMRIIKAVENKELITIYADYDADAITAASVVYLALKKIGGKVDCYIPDRFSEGYGVNADAIGRIVEKGSKLVITVDCGTNAVEEVKLASTLGMNVIVTDHHEITGDLPSAYALINPKNPKDNYPFPYLTGVGVAYKLVQALMSRITDHGSQIIEGWEKWLLDLVAVGIVADCQSLTGENRILVSFGLKVLKKTRCIGLIALMESAKVDLSKLDTFTLGFIIAPRINAAGRIKHAELAFRLLISENILEAQTLATALNDLNIHRQNLTEQILSEAKEQVALIADKKILLASGANWPKGIVGLVAGKLSEEYCRPVLIMEKGEVYATGSARSVSNFNIVEALGFSKDLLTKYGGHNQAAGFTLRNENIEIFYQKLLEYAEVVKFENDLPALLIDAVIEKENCSWEIYEYLEKFAPFGMGNPKPRFLTKGLEILEMRTVGTNAQHLKMKLRFGEHALGAIGFNQGFRSNQLSLGQKIDAVVELNTNEWNGNKSLEFKIIDIRFTNNE